MKTKLKKVEVPDYFETDIILKNDEYEIEELCEMLNVYNPDDVIVSVKSDKGNLKIIFKI